MSINCEAGKEALRLHQYIVMSPSTWHKNYFIIC